MDYQTVSYKVMRRFKVEIERDDSEEKERRYTAYCPELTGCAVNASNKVKALHKIRQAIDVWLDLADRQLSDQASGIREMIDMRVPN